MGARARLKRALHPDDLALGPDQHIHDHDPVVLFLYTPNLDGRHVGRAERDVPALDEHPPRAELGAEPLRERLQVVDGAQRRGRGRGLFSEETVLGEQQLRLGDVGRQQRGAAQQAVREVLDGLAGEELRARRRHHDLWDMVSETATDVAIERWPGYVAGRTGSTTTVRRLCFSIMSDKTSIVSTDPSIPCFVQSRQYSCAL